MRSPGAIASAQLSAGTGGGGGGAYAAKAVHFDGATTLHRGGLLTGVADANKYIFAVWVSSALSTINDFIATFPNNNFGTGPNSDGTLYSQGYNTDSGEIFNINSVSTFRDSAWKQVIFTVNGDADPKHKVYVNGVFETSSAAGDANALVSWASAETDWFIASDGYGDMSAVDMAQLYFAPGQWLDLDDPTNMAKFISAGKPIDLLTSGAPTPAVLLDGDASEFMTNKGTGGDFVLSAGTLTNATTSPSD